MLKQVVGKLGEDLAVDFLQAAGYKILERNLRLSHYEIDIVASKEGQIILIEVKTKSTQNPLWQAEDLISPRKYQNLLKAATLYSQRYKVSSFRLKLELITVTVDRENKANIKHYIDII
jgi:putative endonuclease